MTYKVGTGDKEITIADDVLIQDYIRLHGITKLAKSEFYGEEQIAISNEVMSIKRREFREKKITAKN